MIPTSIYALNFILNKNGRTIESKKQFLIDTRNLPEKNGAYVIRYKNNLIARLVGKSSILKIGKAEKGLKNRFDNYNHQKEVTLWSHEDFDEMYDRHQKTNALILNFLATSKNTDSLIIEFYPETISKNSAFIEQCLLKEYIKQHRELPPLHLSAR